MEKNTLTVRGDSGEPKKMIITTDATVSDASIDTFITSVETNLIDGKVVSHSRSTKRAFSKTITAGLTDRKGVLIYLNSTNGRTYRQSFPTLKETTIVELTPEGERLTSAAVAAAAGYLATLTGESLTGQYGYVIQSK